MPKLAFALDDKSLLPFLKELEGFDIIIKVGPIVFLEEGKFLLKALKASGFEVFLDLKFHDIPNTVLKSVEACVNMGIDYLTVHLLGGKDMLMPLKDIKQNINIFGVSILTSHEESYMDFLHSRMSLKDMVLYLAKVANECGIDGIVCSGIEAFDIKKHFNLKTVIPGVRLDINQKDDQERVVSINQIKDVADIIVMGRAIYKSQNPKQTILEILNILNM